MLFILVLGTTEEDIEYFVSSLQAQIVSKPFSFPTSQTFLLTCNNILRRIFKKSFNVS